jgi:hypothetical protein
MSIVLQSSGGGSVTIAEPTTASNFTLSLPSATGTSVIQNGSNNLLMNSGYGSDAEAYGCRAWVNFNGTGTPAIRASGNVSSITDNGTGDYTVNFTTAMPDANYSTVGTSSFDTGTIGGDLVNTRATVSASVNVVNTLSTTNGKRDPQFISVAIFR